MSRLNRKLPAMMALVAVCVLGMSHALALSDGMPRRSLHQAAGGTSGGATSTTTSTSYSTGGASTTSFSTSKDSMRQTNVRGSAGTFTTAGSSALGTASNPGSITTLRASSNLMTTTSIVTYDYSVNYGKGFYYDQDKVAGKVVAYSSAASSGLAAGKTAAAAAIKAFVDSFCADEGEVYVKVYAFASATAKAYAETYAKIIGSVVTYVTPKGATAYGLANAESAAESAALAIAEAQSGILADAYNDCQYADAILIVEAYAEVLVQAYSSAMGAVAASDGGVAYMQSETYQTAFSKTVTDTYVEAFAKVKGECCPFQHAAA